MKSSEIADKIQDKNPKLHIGGVQPFLPLMPAGTGCRRNLDVGWVAFNLIRCLEEERSITEFPQTAPRRLWFNQSKCAFALMKAEHVPMDAAAWEEVEFDGYGGLETWKEVCR